MSLRLIFTSLIFLLLLYFSFSLYTIERQRRPLKEDLIELSKVKYGLFNVDEWKSILSGIISKKIEEFSLQGSSREEMRKKISELLYKIVGDFEKRYQEENSRSIKGFFRGSVASFLGIFNNVKRDVPKFTDQILDFMNQPGNRRAVKGYILKKLNDYADKTFSQADYALHDSIIQNHGMKNRAEAIAHLNDRILSLNEKSDTRKWFLLSCAVAGAMSIFVAKRLSGTEYLLLTFMCLVLLVLGLMIPMIEIDARISSMSFNLLGERISFQDQVLYYKSKSILEVVELMLTQGRFDLLFVGILVFAFSVLFPISKLLSSLFYIYFPSARNNAFIRFMIFKTGKWSMADVMVIAIFMAYIGFSGIITEQLKQIESITQTMEILTTNKSSLLTGFYSFTAFAILSLLVSHKLQYQNETINHGNNKNIQTAGI
jgi:hypothetical protein